eukprot:TRINITY_DN5654_c1_g1_i1.p1 TRINITY_DN5654_c1_g1~~TRINITY_DN5654_c1_g1_i1.p1  ORF type:complete len:1105 (+),score=314.04 TRINITY_DN5654_c1_g1_i1:74-3388(+)
MPLRAISEGPRLGGGSERTPPRSGARRDGTPPPVSRPTGVRPALSPDARSRSAAVGSASPIGAEREYWRRYGGGSDAPESSQATSPAPAAAPPQASPPASPSPPLTTPPQASPPLTTPPQASPPLTGSVRSRPPGSTPPRVTFRTGAPLTLAPLSLPPLPAVAPSDCSPTQRQASPTDTDKVLTPRTALRNRTSPQQDRKPEHLFTPRKLGKVDLDLGQPDSEMEETIASVHFTSLPVQGLVKVERTASDGSAPRVASDAGSGPRRGSDGVEYSRERRVSFSTAIREFGEYTFSGWEQSHAPVPAPDTPKSQRSRVESASDIEMIPVSRDTSKTSGLHAATCAVAAQRRTGRSEGVRGGVLLSLVTIQRALRARSRAKAALRIQMLFRRRQFERAVIQRRPRVWDWRRLCWKIAEDCDSMLKIQRQRVSWEQDPVFKATVDCDLHALQKLVRRNPRSLRHRDENSATPLLVSLLRSTTEPKQRDLAFWIISNYPERARDQQTTDLFRGLCALHTAIVHRDEAMVTKILQAAPASVLCRAVGGFFCAANELQFGEWPLHYAVSTNQPGIVLDILECAEDVVGKPRAQMLDDRDSAGNTVFHMAALHGHKKMYTFLVDLAEAATPVPTCVGQGLHTCSNTAGHTPLMLAALQGTEDMFCFLLERVCSETWRFGPYHHRMVWLDEIEDSKGNGVLRILVDVGDLDKMEHPLIQKILEWKWEAVFALLFRKRARTVALYALIFTAAHLVPAHARPPPTERWDSALLSLLDVAVLLGVCIKTSSEIPELLQSGAREYFGRQGAAQLENVAAFCHCFLMFVTYAAKGVHWAVPGLQSAITLSHCSLALASLLLWLYVLWLLIGFRATGPFVLMILRMVRGDVKLFAVIFLTFLLGFTQAFHVLFENPTPYSFLQRLQECLMALTGATDNDDFYSTPAHSRALVSTLVFTYGVLVSVLLLNLLVAMMSSTYEKVFDEADRVWRLERARIMTSMQDEMQGLDWWLIRPSDGRRFLALPSVTPTDVDLYHADGASSYSEVRRRAQLLDSEPLGATLDGMGIKRSLSMDVREPGLSSPAVSQYHLRRRGRSIRTPRTSSEEGPSPRLSFYGADR